MRRTCAFAVLVTLSAPVALATELVFEVSGVESTEGQLLVALFTQAQFLRSPVRATKVAPVKGKVTGSLGEVPEGTYALSVFHDLNGNGKLDTNFIGIPKEPSGFSNNPVLYGPPTFEKTRIEVRGERQVVQVQLR